MPADAPQWFTAALEAVGAFCGCSSKEAPPPPLHDASPMARWASTLAARSEALGLPGELPELPELQELRKPPLPPPAAARPSQLPAPPRGGRSSPSVLASAAAAAAAHPPTPRPRAASLLPTPSSAASSSASSSASSARSKKKISPPPSSATTASSARPKKKVSPPPRALRAASLSASAWPAYSVVAPSSSSAGGLDYAYARPTPRDKENATAHTQSQLLEQLRAEKLRERSQQRRAEDARRRHSFIASESPLKSPLK